jgi:hypothetical protein
MLRDVVPRFRIAREGGVRRAATGYGVAPAFGKGAVSAALLPAMRLGHCGVARPHGSPRCSFRLVAALVAACDPRRASASPGRMLLGMERRLRRAQPGRRELTTAENRGVPGSSPGLAIS